MNQNEAEGSWVESQSQLKPWVALWGSYKDGIRVVLYRLILIRQ